MNLSDSVCRSDSHNVVTTEQSTANFTTIGSAYSCFIVTLMESMADILSMMRNQGINVEGFEAEAEDIWESLDNMSKKNPEEYRDFIRSQYENSLMPQKEQNGEVESTAPNNSTECDRFFRPIAGFAIKSKTSRGDGIKVRFEDDGKIIFINFCSHPAIEAPLDQNGHYVDTRDLYLKKSADGLKVANHLTSKCSHNI